MKRFTVVVTYRAGGAFETDVEALSPFFAKQMGLIAAAKSGFTGAVKSVKVREVDHV